MTLLIHFCCRYDVLTQLTTRAPYASPIQLIRQLLQHTPFNHIGNPTAYYSEGRKDFSFPLHQHYCWLSPPPPVNFIVHASGLLIVGRRSCQFNISFPSFMLSSCTSFLGFLEAIRLAWLGTFSVGLVLHCLL